MIPESYYVTFRSMENGNRRTEQYQAYTFCSAFIKAQKDLTPREEIIAIERDYKV